LLARLGAAPNPLPRAFRPDINFPLLIILPPQFL
jgi:hypothetical protein